MNIISFSGISCYNKMTAAALSQAVVQLIATFVRFPPELEQAIGIIMTSLMVYLVPNRPAPQSAGAVSPRNGEPLVAHLPIQTAVAALALTLFLAGCVGMVLPGDRLADRLLGPDCGSESRVYRARTLMLGLERAYPALESSGMSQSLAAMETAAAAGRPLDLAGAAFQDALIAAMTPIVLEAGLSGEPIWYSLAQLPPVAAEMVLVRRDLAAFCAGA